MTMHLEGPWLSTTATKKRYSKRTKTEQIRFEEEHRQYNKRMRQQGRHDEMMSLADYDLFVRGILTKQKLMSRGEYVPPKTFHRETEKIASLPFTGGICAKPEQKVYTGTKIKGIGTLHKSNAVPIFSDEEAVEIARMRR